MLALAIVAIGQACVIAYMVRQAGERDAEHGREVAKLLDRIQAPKQAVAASLTEGLPPSPPAVGFDDDNGFWEAQEAMNGRT
jgi:hypothetical protein